MEVALDGVCPLTCDLQRRDSAEGLWRLLVDKLDGKVYAFCRYAIFYQLHKFICIVTYTTLKVM